MNLILFLLVACFWGGSFVAIQPLVHAMPPLMAGALRMGVALVFLTAAFPILRIPFRVPRELRKFVWTTGLMAFGLPFSLLFWGEKSISAGLAGILNGTVPIWVFVFGMIFTPRAEPVTSRKIAGLALGLAGVVAIFLPKIFAAGGDPSILGTLAVTGMAMSYATGVLMNRVIFVQHPHLSPFTNLYQQLVAGFLSLFAVAVAAEGWPRPSEWAPFRTVVIAELYLGVVSTSIAFMIFYQLIRKWGSVRASTVTYVIPAATLGLDLAMNGRIPLPSEILGVVGVTAGVMILNLPTRKAKAAGA